FLTCNFGHLTPQLKRQIAGILPIITNYLRKLYDLMQKEELSDSIVITVSYIAIGPFFVDSANSNGNSIFGNGLEAVKLVALGLLRSIFTNHQKQRTWILEEILTSLIKLPTVKRNLRQYRLPDGKSIQMVSALILQLIQSCTVGITHFGLKSVDDQQSEQLVKSLTNGVPNDLKKEFGAMGDPVEWGYAFTNILLSINEKQADLKWGNKDDASLISITKLMNKIVAEYWQMSSENQIVQSLEYRTLHVERTDIHLLTELLATRQALYQNFDTILSRILISLDTGVVAFRTKALRALGQVVVCDPGILSQVNVRQTIAQRFSDNSPAVRDAAIELVGRYLAQKPEITEQYYKVISDRVLDTGLNVRKRVIKLLRDIYLKSSDQEMKIDIGCKILIRINDDDDHVKDLALKTIQELWFSPFKYQKNFCAETYDLDDDDKWQNEFNNMPASGKKDVLARSLLIVGVAGRLGERNGHIMGGLFKKILDKDGKQKREILSICQCIVDYLFEHLLTLQDSNSK
ncbi:1122_t:CDS:10, partial [Cetraspora pellucida]